MSDEIPNEDVDGIFDWFEVKHHQIEVYIRNDTSHKAVIQLYHLGNFSEESGGFFAEPGQTVGPILVKFRTGRSTGSDVDLWCARLTVFEGEQRKVYHNEGSILYPLWKSCQLQSADVGKRLIFDVNTHEFRINMPSGGESTAMRHKKTYKGVNHIFVLMLENRSFENIFGRSGLPGIEVADDDAYNYDHRGRKVYIKKGAPDRTIADPGHEFDDVREQLTGGESLKDGKYPPINNSGFVQNYARCTFHGHPIPEDRLDDVMACYDTPNQLPVIYSLAKEFAICDHWFSSLPGPTWPNRFFVHGASSVDMDDSPDKTLITGWNTVMGFKYPHGSIFQSLKNYGMSWQIYGDTNNRFAEDQNPSEVKKTILAAGGVPQVAALEGVNYITSIDSLDHFRDDITKRPYDNLYTFIEPHYGDIVSGHPTFIGGSSQHPKDNSYGGENLLKHVYESIRNSPLWYNSMLVVTYDEHGGFYDSVKPPAAVPPNDTNDFLGFTYSSHGFRFDQLGVRVPGVVISPWVDQGKVIKDTMEHSVIPKTIANVASIPTLTDRDATSVSLVDYLNLNASSPRKYCSAYLPSPVSCDFMDMEMDQDTATAIEEEAKKPLPEYGNFLGALSVMQKAEEELKEELATAQQSGDMDQLDASAEEPQEPKTVGEAAEYIGKLFEKMEQRREEHYQERLRQLDPRWQFKETED